MDWYNWVVSIVSILGSIASVIAIFMTYHQVKKVKVAADAAKEASNNTQKQLDKTLGIIQTTKHSERIKIIEQALRANEISLAIYLSQELHAAILELDITLSAMEDYQYDGSLRRHINELGNHIQSMQKSLPADRRNFLNENVIIEDLEILQQNLTKLQITLKK